MFKGDTLALHELNDGIVELCFDAAGQPVNVFSEATIRELGQALAALADASGVRGLLVTSAKKGFIAGADIREFLPVFARDKVTVRSYLNLNNHNNNRLEALPFPVVVAINGFAVGGGLEFCLACDYRVLADDARIGFPEVKLGIVPGWGGTVRAPRVAPLDTALEWVSTGNQYAADKAHAAGMVDDVVAPADLRARALALLSRVAEDGAEYRQRRALKRQPLAIEAGTLDSLIKIAREQAASRWGEHYPAPLAAIDAMAESVLQSRDDALATEFEAFHRMTLTPQCRALVGNFLADQRLESVARSLARDAERKVTRVGVLGAGVMGGGIAYQNAVKGLPVVIKDINQQALDVALAEVKRLLAGQVKKGRLSEARSGQVLERIAPVLDYAPLADCDVVIEAVVEKESVKRTVLAEVENYVDETAVLASNTSSILISTLADALHRPERFCGIHFFNPVHAMPLVEVVRGKQSERQTIALAVALAQAMGKKPVVVNDCPGFLVNRVLFPYLAAFHLLMRDGADFQRIDQVMEAWGWPMGPAWLLDVVGLDVAVHVAEVLAQGFPGRMQFDFVSASEQLLRGGRLGQKSGAGFYRYVDSGSGRREKTVDLDTSRLLSGVVSERRDFSDEEIVARMMIPMGTEMARCLEEGIVGSVEEADIAMQYGLGFPAFRGGVFRWLDEYGLPAFIELTAKYSELGELYRPSSGMLSKAGAGEKYYPV